MVTEFGKILDPVADKLTQGAMAISFSYKYPGDGDFAVRVFRKRVPDGNTWLIYDEKKLPDGWSTEAWKGMYSGT